MKLHLEFPDDYPSPYGALNDLGEHLESLPGCSDYLADLNTPSRVVEILDEAILGGHYED